MRLDLARRKRKVIKVFKKTLPKVFACPQCGMVTVRITSHEDDISHDFVYTVTCGNPNCNVRRELRYSAKKEMIDVYNTFVDDYVRASG